MRKLREAIVASARTDMFALRVYVFVIRVTMLTGHMESYHPALLHLLRHIHPRNPLSDSELQDFIGFYILDLACRQNDLAAAYRARYLYGYRDAKVERILQALVHGDWWAYWRLEGMMDRYQQQLMKWGDDGMRKHVLKCLGQSYLTVEKTYLERTTRRTWEELKKRDGMTWQLEGQTVTIRKIKRK